MRILGLLLVAVISACSLDVSENPKQNDEVIENENSVEVVPAPEQSSRYGCDLYGTVEHEVNGMIVPVPTLCNPDYFDKGDPDPDPTQENPIDKVELPAVEVSLES